VNNGPGRSATPPNVDGSRDPVGGPAGPTMRQAPRMLVLLRVEAAKDPLSARPRWVDTRLRP
jgi:hypothetical protein